MNDWLAAFDELLRRMRRVYWVRNDRPYCAWVSNPQWRWLFLRLMPEDVSMPGYLAGNKN